MKKTNSFNSLNSVFDFEKLARTYKTPHLVQKFVRTLEYNRSETLYSAQKAIQNHKAHCLEGAFVAAAIMEHLGYEPMLLSFESVDDLEHVVYLFKGPNGYGSIGKSRDPGLHGRAPEFRSIKDLAWSYFDPYIDKTGKLTAYQIAHMDELGVDWRRGKRHLWQADRYLVDLPHNPMKSNHQRFLKVRKRYLKYGAIQTGRHWW